MKRCDIKQSKTTKGWKTFFSRGIMHMREVYM
jgi:hypothetical protein